MAMDKLSSIHPGEILREGYLAPLDMSVHALAMELRVPAPRVNEIVRERRAFAPDTALRWHVTLGTTVQFWIKLQGFYDLKQAEIESDGKIEQEVRPLQMTA